MTITTIIILAATGLFAGTVATMLGIGGGVIFVPAIFYYYSLTQVPVDFAMKSAIGTSLIMIFFTMLSGSVGHYRKKNYMPGALIYLAPGSAVGAVAGSQLALMVHGGSLKSVFGVLLIVIAAQMAFGKPRNEDCETDSAADGKAAAATLLCIGLFSGLFSGFLGGGGGIITVPALLYLTKLPIRKCAGTSTMAIVFTSLSGGAKFLFSAAPDILPNTMGYVNLAVAAALVPSSMIGARLGVSISMKTDPVKMRRLFAFVATLVGLEMAGALDILSNLFRQF